MAFLIDPTQRYPAKVTCRFRPKVIGEVYSKLDEEHQRMFTASCFGKLYEMRDNMKISGQLLHALVFLRIQSPDINDLWFRIGGQNVRFGFSDYTITTGLYPGDEEDYKRSIPATKRLANEYFAGAKKSVKPEALNEAFVNAKSELDRYKLGLALVYEAVLRAKESSTSIDLGFLEIVDDLDLFNKYPWGTRTYPNLLHSVKKSSDKVGVKTNTFYGFPFALQVNN